MLKKRLKSISIILLAAVLLVTAGCGRKPELTSQPGTTTTTTGASETTADTTVAATSATTAEPVATTVQPTEETVPTTTLPAPTVPAETTAAPEETLAWTATIAIECHLATADGIAGAAADGVILEEITVAIESGETVWDVLFRVGQEEKIVVTKIGSGSGTLVTSIGGLAMGGGGTGWIYSVNGEIPQISSGAYELKPGDVIKWQYTLDSGKDL